MYGLAAWQTDSSSVYLNKALDSFQIELGKHIGFMANEILVVAAVALVMI